MEVFFSTLENRSAYVGTFAPSAASAKTAGEDLNLRYRFPVSIGMSCRPLSGVGNRSLSDFSINEPGISACRFAAGSISTSSFRGR
jgi:hypothetical protein